MRHIININENWKFSKDNIKFLDIAIPHTWNNIDGQDGGNDYYRGTCVYNKKIDKDLIGKNKTYIEFRGVNSSATILVNGIEKKVHHGGYSTFRIDISDVSKEVDTELVVYVDNKANDFVYPQRADFTFYGGIYRDVYLVTLDEAHFDMDYFGGEGVCVHTDINGENATANCTAYVTGNADFVNFAISKNLSVVANVVDGVASAKIEIPNARLWNGVKDPYLYELTATLIKDDMEIDKKEIKFGCRNFSFDKDGSFMLNGHSYPLRGVSRHQDRKGVGNAITKEMQEEDMVFIKEIGANTIRLAHYQHDQYFYDLCDREGIVVWAEIPYITNHMPNGRDNTISQLSELIVQNYNHCSIVCWGLSNEITVTGCTEDLMDNHRVLNNLAHKLDKTRPTCMAHVFMLDIDEELVNLPDICSYNLYYGWYLGDLEDNDKWFDKFREKYPNKVIGLSEYGADANPKLQTGSPERSDYTEQYQCVYHEHMLEMFEQRPYIWATHVWNMFDFGADGRDEGGEHGVNQKGLVTFDRKHKKDAFYLYKAYWSNEKFVHICGKNYVDRTEEQTTIKVYSTLDEVSLYNNDELVGTKKGNKIFEFSLKITGEHKIVVKANDLVEEINIKKVDKKNDNYYLKMNSVTNWFDNPEIEDREGYYSIKDKLKDIKKTKEGAEELEKLMNVAKAKRGDVASEVKQSKQMEEMFNNITVEMLIKQSSGAITEEMVIEFNKTLSNIKKVD